MVSKRPRQQLGYADGSQKLVTQRQSGTINSVSAGHTILTPTQPIDRIQESRTLPAVLPSPHTPRFPSCQDNMKTSLFCLLPVPCFTNDNFNYIVPASALRAGVQTFELTNVIQGVGMNGRLSTWRKLHNQLPLTTVS